MELLTVDGAIKNIKDIADRCLNYADRFLINNNAGFIAQEVYKKDQRLAVVTQALASAEERIKLLETLAERNADRIRMLEKKSAHYRHDISLHGKHNRK